MLMLNLVVICITGSNFGERPTVNGVNLLLETHIFGNKNIYGRKLTVEFLTF